MFELLQIAIGNREMLSRALSDEEWSELYYIFKKHSLLGVGYAGILKLPQDQRLPLKHFVQWIHDGERIKDRNNLFYERCKLLTDQLYNDGFYSCILKGQSNCLNYPTDLACYRTSGDIDIWVKPIEKCAHPIHKTLDYIFNKCERHKLELGYHHTEFPIWEDIEIEMHYRPTWLSSPVRNYRLQKWAKQNNQCDEPHGEIGFVVPSNSFNAVYQLTHIYNHLFEEGVGLRQLLDYYFVLKALHKEQNQGLHINSSNDGDCNARVLSNSEVLSLLDKFGMRKFASAIMYVLKTVFLLPDECLLCQVNDKEGRWLLKEIMLSGNFGRYDIRNRNIHNKSGWIRHIYQVKRAFRYLRHYPEEVFMSPFRFYHVVWRKLELWRF